MAAERLPWLDDRTPPFRMGRKGISHGVPFWNGGKRSGTYIFFHASPPLLLPPSRRHQLLKLMATRRHSMAIDGTLSLLIAFNVVEEDNAKLRVSIF